ncbi:hypothetical protein U1Q18_009925 [Sarracenia purpurea var. burkii]
MEDTIVKSTSANPTGSVYIVAGEDVDGTRSKSEGRKTFQRKKMMRTKRSMVNMGKKLIKGLKVERVGRKQIKGLTFRSKPGLEGEEMKRVEHIENASEVFAKMLKPHVGKVFDKIPMSNIACPTQGHESKGLPHPTGKGEKCSWADIISIRDDNETSNEPPI